ncbi:hypothetical protein C479_07508 [Halovivax asiaticus JCM 14624]|uniref:Uncharacterized protein n=1 Tax=Halovivax asiaticus JCM 14624 TaxID=1227490 RepID=M0BKY0_9EURY|nr:hypothetical protein [Halovivax asiaticus]ELZ11137.1 hypothetical protein C479_07508 [Halovivax asiaticus JCM 14624]
MKATARSLRALLSNPIVRESVLLVFLLVGSHLEGVVEVPKYVSIGAVIPILVGLFAGIGLRLSLGDESDWSAFPHILVVFVVGGAFSWIVSAALFGSVGESVRISGFCLAVLLGSVLARSWRAGRRLGTTA